MILYVETWTVLKETGDKWSVCSIVSLMDIGRVSLSNVKLPTRASEEDAYNFSIFIPN